MEVKSFPQVVYPAKGGEDGCLEHQPDEGMLLELESCFVGRLKFNTQGSNIQNSLSLEGVTTV